MLQSFKDDGDKYNWEMTKGGTVEEFFGIQENPIFDGGFNLTQLGLIEKVLITVGM